VWGYGLDVSMSGYGCECKGWLYLGQNRGMNIWAGCIWVRIRVCGYGLVVSRSGYGCESMAWLVLGQDMGVSLWASCI
jgi:hypothetical protein